MSDIHSKFIVYSRVLNLFHNKDMAIAFSTFDRAKSRANEDTESENLGGSQISQFCTRAGIYVVSGMKHSGYKFMGRVFKQDVRKARFLVRF